MKVPQDFIAMNAEGFESFFKSKCYYSDSLIISKKQGVEQLTLMPNHVFLQDTTNIFNNILILNPPFIPMNKSNFKSVRTMMRRTLNERFSNHEIEEKESSMNSGTYPYVKVIYKVQNEDEHFQIAYYIVTKRNETKFIIVNNVEKLDFEEMIQYLE